MRRSREEKAETRSAIVDHASRLFRERGVEKTSVGDVMAEAGLTHGGFYRHFETKEALVAETVRAIFDGILGDLQTRASDVGPNAAGAAYLAFYLSDEHLGHPGIGCPVPTLASEIARAPETLKAEFGASIQRTLETLASGLAGNESEKRAQAAREFAMRVGAILIARASDAATAQEVLAACRDTPTSAGAGAAPL